MAVNKVKVNGQTLIDLSSITLTDSSELAKGIVAHTALGEKITGTMSETGSGDINPETFNVVEFGEEGYSQTNRGPFSSGNTNETKEATPTDLNCYDARTTFAKYGNIVFLSIGSAYIKRGFEYETGSGNSKSTIHKYLKYLANTKYLMFKIPAKFAPKETQEIGCYIPYSTAYGDLTQKYILDTDGSLYFEFHSDGTYCTTLTFSEAAIFVYEV